MNRSFIFLFILIFSLFFSFSFTTIINAQGIASKEGINLKASTENPAPNQKMTITAKSFSINIDSATLIWSVNGKIVQKGIGITTLEILAPELGKQLDITVSATTPEKITMIGSTIIKSGYIDMIVETSGFTPPFFKGKNPISYQNTITIIAIPHLANAKGIEFDPKTLVYTWKKNGRTEEGQNGYGRQTLTITGDIVPRESTYTVTVSTRDSMQGATGYVAIPFYSPSLTFYEDSSLYGPLFNKAISDSLFIGKEKEVSVLAIPYGFNKPISGLGNLGLNWMVNGFTKPELAENESITLRAPDGSDGTSNVELTISNKKDILQNASNNFSVRFSSKSSNNNAGTNF